MCVFSIGLPLLSRVIIHPSPMGQKEGYPYSSFSMVSKVSCVLGAHSHPSSCESTPASIIRERSMAGPDINVRASRTTDSGSSGLVSRYNTRDPMAKSIMMMEETNAGS